MRARAALALVAVAAWLPARAAGQARGKWDARGPAGPTGALSASGSLLARVGTDAAIRLMKSQDPDERLRGIERAAAIHTGASLLLLERAARTNGPGGFDPRLPESGVARKDPRALLAAVRGLAAWVTDPGAKVDEGARIALVEIVRAPNEAFSVHGAAGASGDDARELGRVILARQEAAVALATSGDPVALEQLVAAAQSGGAAEEPALLALSIRPPAEPSALGPAALTTPATIALAGRVGDLRVLDAIVAAARASDPLLRAAALNALGDAGDTRGLEPARDALRDDDARVRVAGAEALARLGSPEAPEAIAALIHGDETVLEGLRLAMLLQDEEITKAAAARAVEAADPMVREAAVAALGRQTSPAAIQALSALAQLTAVRGIALSAVARSPSPAAMAAIEALAKGPDEARRLAARAYFVRAFTRGERSSKLDALLGALGASPDPRDRAVSVEARIALGRMSLASGLADPDPRVRRAAVMGALAIWDGGVARTILAQGRTETDPATRRLLALAWSDPQADASLPAEDLRARLSAGGPDAPLAARALARRAEGEIDALLASPDPLVRAEAALGLGQNPAPDAAARLEEAYRWEEDAGVRRALVRALAARGPGAGALGLAAQLDPDAVVRWTASVALRRGPGPAGAAALAAPTAPGGVREVAWLSLAAAEGSPAPLDLDAAIVDGDGGVLPIAFDDEGFALIPGLAPGKARVELAPELPAYTAPPP